MNINMSKQVESNRVLDAIAALKEKGDTTSGTSNEGEVDLLSIVKKLSRNREKVTRNGK